MKQELYIDGIAVDIDSDTSVTLNVKSNLFRDITKMTANTTYTIKLPRTAKNAKIFGYAEVVQASTAAPYQYHDCRYFRNGVEIIKNGKAVLLSVSDKYEISVIWGINAALSRVADDSATLNTLNGNDSLRWHKFNALTPYDTFLAEGIGYANYNVFHRAEVATDWESKHQSESVGRTSILTLEDGAIVTGTSTGSAIAMKVDESYTDFGCASVAELTLYNATRINMVGVVGGGEARAYAFLDGDKNVIGLAPSMLTSGSTTETIVGTTISSVEADVVCYNSASADITHGGKITQLSIMTRASDAALEFGFINTASGEMRKVGILSVRIGQNTISVEAEKDVNEVVYLKPSTANVLVRLADSAFTSYTINGETKASVVGQCFAFRTHYEVYDYPQNIGVDVPSNAEYVVFNVNRKYSSPSFSVMVTYGIYADSITQNASTKASTEITEYGILVHPSVTADWVLKKISEKWGLSITADDETSEFISRLAIPLISHESAEGLQGTSLRIEVEGRTGYGALTMKPYAASEIFSDGAASTSALHVTQDTKVAVDIVCRWSWNPSGVDPSYFWDFGGTRFYTFITPAVYILMTITHEPEEVGDEADTDTYLIGIGEEGKNDQVAHSSADINDGRLYMRICGTGTLELEEGDTITMELKSTYPTIDINGFSFHGGTFLCDVPSSEDVPNGGLFPIQKNLPEIKVTDFLKFICAITGTFPRQKQNSTSVELERYDTLYQASEAYDWTERLIPYDEYNRPREESFSADDFNRANWYRWKTDDSNAITHDGCLNIANATLDETRDAITFAFACSEGNHVPIYESDYKLAWQYPNIAVSNIDAASYAYTYKECKDRILQVEKTAKGNASLIFGDDMDMQHIIDTKYAKLRETLNEARIVKEYVRLTDIDIMNFNEARPVYFAQFGAYFAVTEIKQTANGYSEVTMIRIKI